MPLEFRPKLDKIVELLLYLAQEKPGADKYQAVKFFYLADREHLNRYGRPITYEYYYALPYGPVASKAKELIEEDRFTMREAGLVALPFRTERISREGPDRADIVVLVEPLRDVDFSLFSKSDIRVFDEILVKYGNMDFDQLYKLTHSHEAYTNAWQRRGYQNRSRMNYEEMIESPGKREKILTDVGPIASHV